MTREHEAEWQVILGRVMDLAVDAFYLKIRLDAGGGSDGFRSIFMAEQMDKARALRDDLSAFLKARLAEAAAPSVNLPTTVSKAASPVPQVRR